MVLPLKTHTCTPEELGIDEKYRSQAKFMKVKDTYRHHKIDYKDNMICIENADSHLHGDYHSEE